MMVGMMALSVVFVCYRLCTIFFQPFRFLLLHIETQSQFDKEITKSIRYVLGKCYIGDWFVLYQISENTNRYFFRSFIKELRTTLKRLDAAKQSKAAAKKANNSRAQTNNESSSVETVLLVEHEEDEKNKKE